MTLAIADTLEARCRTACEIVSEAGGLASRPFATEADFRCKLKAPRTG